MKRKLLIIILLATGWGRPVVAQLMKLVATQPRLVINGVTYPASPGQQHIFEAGFGVYTITVSGRAVPVKVQALAGGGGGSTGTTGFDGAGGGGSAAIIGYAGITLLPGFTYTAKIGIGGGDTTDGTLTSLDNGLGTTLLLLTPGLAGGNGASAGAGGGCIIPVPYTNGTGDFCQNGFSGTGGTGGRGGNGGNSGFAGGGGFGGFGGPGGNALDSGGGGGGASAGPYPGGQAGSGYIVFTF